jgi:tRNA pseudouridine55 synthase
MGESLERDVDGILLLDKPVGLSSNAALQRVKRLLGARRAGHTGSLDPLASGMLPVCLGQATKMASALLESRKCYRFTVALGARTATGDAEGEVIERRDVPPLDGATVTAALARCAGRREQVPPMYSALKRDGQPLYRLARRGIDVPRKPRLVHIERLDLERLEATRLALSTVCSKGTYIRSLAEEIAVALQTCGHVVELRRSWVEPFEDEPMQGLAELERVATQEARRTLLLPPDRALRGWPRVDLDAERARRLWHGQTVATDEREQAARVRVYGPDGCFVGCADRDAAGTLTARRLMADDTP